MNKWLKAFEKASEIWSLRKKYQMQMQVRILFYLLGHFKFGESIKYIKFWRKTHVPLPMKFPYQPEKSSMYNLSSDSKMTHKLSIRKIQAQIANTIQSRFRLPDENIHTAEEIKYSWI